jgi:hypothetical protein
MGHYDEQRDNHNNQTACAKYLFERFDYRVNMSTLMEQLSITHSALDSALADFMEGRQANLQGLIKHAARMRCEGSAALLVRQWNDRWLDALEGVDYE